MIHRSKIHVNPREKKRKFLYPTAVFEDGGGVMVAMVEIKPPRLGALITT